MDIARSLAALLFALCPSSGSAAQDQSAPDLARHLSPEPLAFVEAPGLSRFLERGLEAPFLRALLDSPIGRDALAKSPYTPEQGLALLEQLLGRPPLATFASLCDAGLALAVEERGGEPLMTLVARSSDDLLWEEMIDKTLRWIGARAGAPAGIAEPLEEVRGARLWKPAASLFLAARDGLAVLSNSEGRLRDALEPREGEGLARRPGAARARRTGGELLWAWIDLAKLRARGASQGSTDELARLAQQPAVQMLLGAGVAALGRSGMASASLSLGERELALRIEGFEVEAGATARLLPERASGEAARVLLPRPTPGEVARLVVHRDLAGVFAHRADLFPASELPAFSKASDDLAPLLGGLDLGEEILPRISPWMRVVVRPVQFVSGAVPEIALPAAALLLDLEDDELGAQLASSFQTLVSLLGIQRAQEGMRPLLLQVESFEGLQLSFARFLSPAQGEGVDIAYNLEPACTLVGRTFVVGTHRALVRELALQLLRGETEVAPGDRDTLALHAAPLAQVLRENFDALVMQGVLSEGKSLEKASEDLKGLVGLLELVESARVTTHYRGARELGLELELALRAQEQGR